MTELFIPPGCHAETFPCAACGHGVVVAVADDCPPSMLAIIGRMAAHDDCAKKARDAANNKQAAERLHARSERWETMCPPEFRKPIEFGRPGNNLALHTQLMTWTFEQGLKGKRGVLAHGGTARCKTRYMFALCEREFKAFRQVVCLTHTAFRRELSYLSREEPKQAKRYLEMLLNCDVLFIDDLGKGELTPSSEEAFEHVVSTRASYEKPMLFTSNDSMATLEKRLSPDRGLPIIRRLLECCDSLNFG